MDESSQSERSLVHKYGKHKKKYKIEAQKVKELRKQSERSQLLLQEEGGFLEADANEHCYQISQKEIVQSLDITAATKHFELNLEFGPYSVNYFRNGRQLLLGGERGHVAAIDWVTKDLLCEFNAMESVHDICWLHMPTMFAVAQKDWVHVYDNQGTEVHCLKKLFRVKKLTFLPYHFLLVSASENAMLSWTDVSIGKIIASFRPPKAKTITAMCQNPANAVILTAHSNGTVSMFTPNSNEPVVKMLCSPCSITGVAVNDTGLYMATTGVDRSIKIWDVRNYQCLQSYKLRAIPNCLCFSQKNLLSVGIGNVVEVYKDCCTQVAEEPYIRHKLESSMISNVQFCNYEDVLGIGHRNGFVSILVPGSGEPNFDAYESNPFMTKSQRREMEVKQLLEKIQPELISLDPHHLAKVDVKTLKQKLEEKSKLLYVKPRKIEFESSKKMSGVKKAKVKKDLQESVNREHIQQVMKMKRKEDEKEKDANKSYNVLDRFKRK
ncbi:WD repeat-containing protein 46-like protein [Dinothrombium tinctorium]|uniref:WD repeat-containing protein 46-like protein n=1 Tax=Dinothrombium tinctorium TaxID=1965070 RepID=A0A443QZF9_9ACAR|nr:WD repeat-containing protein 46-like protein [Dinothrombium tinctorium]